MVKKKIIIVSHNLRIGGVERSLIGLLNSFDYTKYHVDLFLFVHDGELFSLLPKEVNLLPENKKYKGQILSVKENLVLGNLDLLIQKYRAKKAANKYLNQNKLSSENMVYSNYLQKYALTVLPNISNVEYDLAISFLTPHYTVTEKVNAKKSIAWIHTDYSLFEFDKKAEIEMWQPYDHIAGISEDSTKGFVQQFPELKEKVIIIENILHPKFIHEQASVFHVEQEMPKIESEFRFCSVGRFSHAKNFDQVPFMAKRLLEKGVKFKWYLIGFGADEALIRDKIYEADMEKHVIILGLKQNPYPYMKACDVYLQPSRYEGKAVTVREAQILGKPVVITKFPTSGSQLNDGVDGVIVPMDIEGCVNGIYQLLQNPSLLNNLVENCKNGNFGNEEEVEKIYVLITK